MNGCDDVTVAAPAQPVLLSSFNSATLVNATFFWLWPNPEADAASLIRHGSTFAKQDIGP